MLPSKITSCIAEWLSELENYPPDRSILTLYFGLYESPNGYCFYLTGSEDLSEESEDWRLQNDYAPECYLEIPHSISGSCWERFFEFANQVLTSFISSPEAGPDIYRNVKTIAIGFDDGDLSFIRV